VKKWVLSTVHLPLACTWVVLSGVVALLGFVLYMTFVPGLPTDPGFTLKHWTSIANSRLMTRVIPNTAIIGFGATFVASFFAIPLAWLLNRTALPLRNTFTTMIAVVPVIPGFISAMAWIMLLDERIGLLNMAVAGLFGLDSIPLGVKNSPIGIAWVMGVILTPPLFFLVAGPMRAMDPALEEVASVVGVTQWRTLFRVTLPLVWPGILGGLIYVFMTAVSIFEIPALLGAGSGKVPVLASEIFYAVRPAGPESINLSYGVAGVYGVLLAVPSLAALSYYLHILARAERYQVITGRGYRPRVMDLGGFKWLGVAFIVLYLILAVVLPVLVLVWVSLIPVLQLPSAEALSKVSLAYYDELWDLLGGTRIIGNTALLMLSVTLLVSFFSFMISWVVVRTQVRSRKLIDMIAMLPHAIPGLAFAFALAMLGILASKWLPWLSFSGTLGIIVIAHLINRLPYGTRVTNAALAQVHRELEESAQVCGTRNVTIMWRIVVPLVKPSLLYLALWTALLSFQEVTLALFLSGPHNQVVSVNIWELWGSGEIGAAAAGAVTMVAVMGVIMFIIFGVTGSASDRRRGWTQVAAVEKK